MPVESWFSVPVYVEDLPGAPELCDELLPFIRRVCAGRPNQQPLVTGGAYSGSNSPSIDQYLFRFPELHRLYAMINEHAAIYAREIGIDVEREHLYLGRSWVNILGRGGQVRPHNHMATVFSGAFYLKIPRSGTVLRFTDPKQVVRKDPWYTAGVTPFNVTHVDYPVVKGRLVLFPGYLTHGMVDPNPDDDDRVSMSVDYFGTSLAGQSPPPPPRGVAERLWKQLDDEMEAARRALADTERAGG